MGAPKQKWTAEEEAALKAGIQRHGPGKWRTILNDPEFSTALHSRSNVDLKDKWRNWNCMVNGSGSRNRNRVSIKSSNQLSEEDAAAHNSVDPESIPSDDAGQSQEISRLDNLIMEAIIRLKEPRGSSRPMIAQYIKEHCSPPLDFERSLAKDLNTLTANGLLEKRYYRIAPRKISPGIEQPVLITNGTKNYHPEKKGVEFLTRAKIEAELENMKSMSSEEAAKAAAKAVSEAENAIAEAEQAAKEAEVAEAEAEVARCFSDAAHKALSWPIVCVCSSSGVGIAVA